LVLEVLGIFEKQRGKLMRVDVWSGLLAGVKSGEEG